MVSPDRRQHYGDAIKGTAEGNGMRCPSRRRHHASSFHEVAIRERIRPLFQHQETREGASRCSGPSDRQLQANVEACGLYMANAEECWNLSSGADGMGDDCWIDECVAELDPLPLRRHRRLTGLNQMRWCLQGSVGNTRAQALARSAIYLGPSGGLLSVDPGVTTQRLVQSHGAWGVAGERRVARWRYQDSHIHLDLTGRWRAIVEAYLIDATGRALEAEVFRRVWFVTRAVPKSPLPSELANRLGQQMTDRVEHFLTTYFAIRRERFSLYATASHSTAAEPSAPPQDLLRWRLEMFRR
jgi:hypothetical protein